MKFFVQTFLFLLLFNGNLTAADINLEGGCVDAPATLVEGVLVNGRPSYSGPAVLLGNPVTVAIYWEPAGPGWVIAASGQPLFINFMDTSLPPATSLGGWGAVPGEPCGALPPMVSGAGALPVEFIYFNAIASQENVLLEWATASEQNNKGFEIQHGLASGTSSEISWKKIGFVEGKGTTTTRSVYSFYHDQPAVGDNYYRLQQVDYDGAFEYTEIKHVNIHKDKNNLIVYPNPVKGILHLSVPVHLENISGPINFQILNAAGQLVKDGNFETNNHTIDLSNLNTGIYSLKLQSGNNSWIERIMISK